MSLGALALLLAGCDQMAVQKRYTLFGPAALFPDGKVQQAPPDGVVARDAPSLAAAQTAPPPMSLALVARGRDRYAIFCTPCHDASGRGRGIVPARGFPTPPDYLDPKVLALTDDQIAGVIRDGYGAMYGFGDRIGPADRWAIAAYVRSLQISQGGAAALGRGSAGRAG